MPIRFACPHCRQKLSVSSRKAGLTAECPRCQRLLTIPAQPAEDEAAIADAAAPAVPLSVEEGWREGVSEATAPAPTAEASDPHLLPEGEGTEPAEQRGFEGLELVYDTPPSRAKVTAPPVAADLIAVPRYAIYLQGGLLALVAFVAFVIGLLAGGTLLSGPAAPPAPRLVLISGSITYASGPRQLPDEGAVVAVIPQSQNRPDEKAPIEGLRPGDPTPDADHRGLAILRELGGGYTRADAGGRFQIQVPSGGRYLVLVISHEKQTRSADEINTADILKLGPIS